MCRFPVLNSRFLQKKFTEIPNLDRRPTDRPLAGPLPTDRDRPRLAVVPASGFRDFSWKNKKGWRFAFGIAKILTFRLFFWLRNLLFSPSESGENLPFRV